MEQEELQKLVEENIDDQVGLDAAFVAVTFGINCIEVGARPNKESKPNKGTKTGAELAAALNVMRQEWLDTAKDLIEFLGEKTDLLYEQTGHGPHGFILHLVEDKTYEQYVNQIFKRIEEIKSQLRMYADRDESEWGGNPQDTLDSFIEELTSYVTGLPDLINK